MKVKITGYKTGVFDKEDNKDGKTKTITYQHMYIEKPLKAYRDADVAYGYETLKVKVLDSVADYIENYIGNYGCLPAEPVEVLFDMYGRVEDVVFDV